MALDDHDDSEYEESDEYDDDLEDDDELAGLADAEPATPGFTHLTDAQMRKVGVGRPNFGRLVQANVVAVTGGFQLAPTLLIADTEPKPQQWMVTIAPPVQSNNTLLPWYSSFDGTATVPNNNPASGGYNFGAPLLPVLGLTCQVRWGAGAATFTTQFDYPYNGAVFGVTAETLYLEVLLKQGQAPITYATMAEVPYIGAFMVEGRPANPTPLRWLDVGAIVPATASGTIYWPVRPFARTLDLYITNGSPAADFELVWCNADGTAVYTTSFQLATTTGNFSFDIPPTAIAWSLTQTGASAPSVQPVSEISFA